LDAVILSSDDIRRLVSMTDAIAAVRDGFVRLSRGEFELPTRTALRDGHFLVMAAHHIPTATAVVKTVSINFDGRLPAILGMVSWEQLERTDHLLADAGAITAIRTAAATGAATDLLARTDAATMTMIGTGAQSADQVSAVLAVRAVTSIVLVDRVTERAESLAERLRAQFPAVRFDISGDAEAAVAVADIVSCATPSTEPLFKLSALKPDVHVNAIGAFRPSMRELPDELLADADVVYVDEIASILEESGEILHALAAGAIDEGHLVEIGGAFADGVPPRAGRTVFKTVGVAMQDWALMNLLTQRIDRT
jgi:ornithine cyclodeaminase